MPPAAALLALALPLCAATPALPTPRLCLSPPPPSTVPAHRPAHRTRRQGARAIRHTHAPAREGLRRLAVAPRILHLQLASARVREEGQPALPCAEGPRRRARLLERLRFRLAPGVDSLLRPHLTTPTQPYPRQIAWLPDYLVEAEQEKPFACPERTRFGNSVLGLLNSKGLRATLVWVTLFDLSRRDHCADSGLETGLALKTLQFFLAWWYAESHGKKVRGTGLKSR